MKRTIRIVAWGILLGLGAWAAQRDAALPARAYFVSGAGIELKEATAGDLESAVKISFLGNCGFFISGDGRNILFDAPQRQANYPNSATPEDAFQKMIGRTEPFEKIDLMLVSHDHPDHITSDMAFRVLQNHPETTMVANNMAPSKIRERNPVEYERTKDRIVDATAEFGEMIRPKAYVIMHNAINDARKYEATIKVYPNAIGFVGPMETKIFIKK